MRRRKPFVDKRFSLPRAPSLPKNIVPVRVAGPRRCPAGRDFVPVPGEVSDWRPCGLCGTKKDAIWRPFSCRGKVRPPLFNHRMDSRLRFLDTRQEELRGALLAGAGRDYFLRLKTRDMYGGVPSSAATVVTGARRSSGCSTWLAMRPPSRRPLRRKDDTMAGKLR